MFLLRFAISAQKGFSWRLPWCARWKSSTGPNVSGNPVVSPKARS